MFLRYLDEDVRAGRKRAVLVVQRDVVHQRVVEEPSKGAQLGTDSQSEAVTQWVGQQSLRNFVTITTTLVIKSSHLVTKETVRRFPQQNILVGGARGGVPRCVQVIVMDDRSLRGSRMWEEPSVRMKHLETRKKIRRWTQLLGVCLMCTGESRTGAVDQVELSQTSDTPKQKQSVQPSG